MLLLIQFLIGGIPLHLNEFPIGSCLDYQDVRMVGAMFGGKADGKMGSTTSGGTESLMLAVRSALVIGVDAKGHKVGQSCRPRLQVCSCRRG